MTTEEFFETGINPALDVVGSSGNVGIGNIGKESWDSVFKMDIGTTEVFMGKPPCLASVLVDSPGFSKNKRDKPLFPRLPVLQPCCLFVSAVDIEKSTS